MISTPRVLLIVSMMLLGLGLILGSGWRLMGELASLGATKLEKNLKQNMETTQAQWTRAIDGLEEASRRNHFAAAYLAQSADLKLKQIRSLQALHTAQPVAQVTRVRDLSVGAVSLAPADPYAWFILGLSQQSLEGLSPQALAYLKMSIRTGPIEGQLLVPRISFCFAHWSNLPVELRQAARHQIRLALSHHRLVVALAQYTHSLDPTRRQDFVNIVRAASASDPKSFGRYAYWLRQTGEPSSETSGS